MAGRRTVFTDKGCLKDQVGCEGVAHGQPRGLINRQPRSKKWDISAADPNAEIQCLLTRAGDGNVVVQPSSWMPDLLQVLRELQEEKRSRRVSEVVSAGACLLGAREM